MPELVAASATDARLVDAFFQGKPGARAVFDQVAARMAGWPSLHLTATKSRVSFTCRTRFAWCAAAQKNGSIYLRFLFPTALDSPRLRCDAMGGRWSLRVHLQQAADVDDELMAWLRAAYEFDVAGIREPRTTRAANVS